METITKWFGMDRTGSIKSVEALKEIRTSTKPNPLSKYR